uniref:Putative ovule protein n=1 Tax=Solanum chacoense TaxID=4108 RepID=A0A0V0GK90_SOLCH
MVTMFQLINGTSNPKMVGVGCTYHLYLYQVPYGVVEMFVSWSAHPWGLGREMYTNLTLPLWGREVVSDRPSAQDYRFS